MKQKGPMCVGAGGAAAGGVQDSRLNALGELEQEQMGLEVMKHAKLVRSEG